MKENYLKVIMSLLVVVIMVQAYYLYDENRSEGEVFAYSLKKAPFILNHEEWVNSFFNENKNPFVEMERLRHKMEENFMDMASYFQAIPEFNEFFSESYRMPRFDMKEQNGKYVLIMEIPGSLIDAIDVKIENGKLAVSAKASKEKDDDFTNYYYHERQAVNYRREVTLPLDADVGSLKKEYKDGLLILTISKKNSLEK